MAGFNFNGTTKSYIKIKNPIRPSWAEINRNLINITGMPGAYLESTTINVRVIEVDVKVEGISIADLQVKKEDLAAWLVTDQPVPLIFDDEPNRIYYAVIDGSFDPEELVGIGKGTLTFICPDPFKYENAEQTASVGTGGTITVGGNIYTKPITKVTLSADTSYVAISNGDKLNMVGMPAKDGETAKDTTTQKYKTTCDSLTGWVAPASTEDGTVLGTMLANGTFYATNYGAPSGWGGPAMKVSIGSTVQDFQFEYGFSMSKTAKNQAGGIVVSLLDASNNVVAKLKMMKHFGGTDVYYASMRAGTSGNGYNIISESGKAVFKKSAIGCIFRIYRVGTSWTAQIYEAANGKYKAPYTVYWKDTNNIASAAVTQIQVQILKRGAFPTVTQTISDIIAYQKNAMAATDIPFVGKAGDIIEFDHTTDVIRRNGEEITKDKAFIGEYFPVYPGANAILVEPSDSVSATEVRWTNRWR